MTASSITTPIGSDGAMTLDYAPNREHLSFAKHLTAEVKTGEFVAGKGPVIRWERIRRQNHWFDALYNACVAASGNGIKLVNEVLPEPPPPDPGLSRITTMAGRGCDGMKRGTG